MKPVCFLSCLLLAAAACGRHHEPPPPPSADLPAAQVQIAAAETRREPEIEEVVGTVRARLHAVLEARISGRVQALPVVLGQRVKAGERIAHLEAAEIQARFDQAQAALQQAQQDWDRASSLFKSQASTRSDFDRAEAQEKMARATAAEAEAMLRYTEIRAPFAGVISRKWAEVGDLAGPGHPLVELDDLSRLQLDADLPEAIASRAQLGSVLQVRVDGLEGEVAGKVSERAPSADPETRTIKVKLDLPPQPGLLPGRFARARVPIAETERLIVPNSAVVRRGQLEMVFLVSHQRAHLQLVKTGVWSTNQVEILSGLEAGARVVIEGAPLLRDGQPVQTN